MTAVAVKVVCQDHPRVTLIWRGISTAPDSYGQFLASLIGREGSDSVTYNAGTAKLQGRCRAAGCRTHVQWRSEKVDEVLQNLAEPGAERTWAVTPTEMDAMTRRPQMARDYLAKR
jgi:hypothetical protein